MWPIKRLLQVFSMHYIDMSWSFFHSYLCWKDYDEARYSSLMRPRLPNVLNYVTGWGVHCLLHKNRFCSHLSSRVELLLFYLCACDIWGGEGAAQSITYIAYSFSLGVRADEREFILNTTPRKSTAIYLRVGSVQSYQK